MMDNPDGDDEENYAGSLTENLTVHVNLGEYLAVNKGRLTFCHINCNHLVPHINELRIMLQNSGVDVIGVGETFLTDSISSEVVEVQGYRFVRNDRSVLARPGTAGGGVGLFLKNGLTHRVVAKSIGLGIEYLFVEVHCGRGNILVGIVYRPPNTSIVYRGLEAANYGLNELEKVLADLLPMYDQAYLFGDFNIDLLDPEGLLHESFVDLLNIFMLYNVSLQPTRQVSGKLLDLFLTTDGPSVSDFYQLNLSWSDHDMIFMSIDVIALQAGTIVKKVRNFKNIVQSELLEAAVLLDWESIPFVSGLNAKIEVLYTFLNHLLDVFAPIKYVKKKKPVGCVNGFENWFNEECQIAVDARNAAYKVWHDNINKLKGDNNWKFFTEKRRVAKRLTVYHHSNFVTSNLDPRLPSKKLFDNLRKFGIVKSKKSTKFDVNVDDLSNHFVVTPSDVSQLDFNIPVVQNVPSFSFKTVECPEVLEAVKSIDSDAAGIDEIPLCFIKLLLPVILPSLTSIFNHIFTCSEFPQRWKTSIVIPVPKISNPSTLSDFRPISLLPCLSKIIEVIMARQMTQHINENNLLSPLQSGFRRSHSTTTAVLKVTEDIRMNLEKGQATVVVFLDFSQAFDTVVRALLGHKLKNSYAFAEDACKLLGSYLFDRNQIVRTECAESEIKPTLCGVPQGSVVGPLLYICYSNDVCEVIQFCKFHAYADDLQLYHSADVANLQRCYAEVNSDLSRIAEWARKNGLKLNPKKSQVMLIHRLANDLPQPHLVIDSDTVKVVPKAVNLGFVLNTRLTPIDHFSKVCQKIYWVLRSLRPHSSCTPKTIKKKLINTLILTHINYSNIVFSHIDSASSRKIGVAYNACLRYIHGLGRRDSVTDLQESITGLNLQNSATLQLLKFVFKVKYSRHPSYIYSLLQFGSSDRTNNLNLPICRRNAMCHSFAAVASKTWNALPHAIKPISILGRFTMEVRKHLSKPPGPLRVNS
jgi:hypothetical protein